VWKQLLIQFQAVCLVIVWTATVAFVGFQVVKLLVGLRVPEEEEREGLDITSHGERAYDL
jgi:Amt family ammonium transporter